MSVRTNEERMRLIRKKTLERRRAAHRRGLDALCAALGLLAVTGIGVFMPGAVPPHAGNPAESAPGAAALMADHAALGYILMGVLAFLLGVCVTVLLYRLRRRKGREDGDSEL